ncbi:hypothetical protein NY2A_b528L [Paramecium bursaria Chlorella virus NY2A]|uniref:Uncharacterized protein b528L n=1 Tax=Paramecium bursaria Chlorella virus NY2A TaxID=46021 RepID=A7IX53_PBCVN|nr:hypothetical protein NY2A_b528L [Paramecium bursaria Chlorella virus NY2A]ABT14927.1 hypothetical protein NY2A_b528L [Paramecium bursaria Chlorella virus NY2A]
MSINTQRWIYFFIKLKQNVCQLLDRPLRFLSSREDFSKLFFEVSKVLPWHQMGTFRGSDRLRPFFQ